MLPSAVPCPKCIGSSTRPEPAAAVVFSDIDGSQAILGMSSS